MRVQRDEPKYRRIKREIESWIAAGKIRSGDKIPVEHELAARFGVSRQTVRQAISELVHTQILEQRQGSGTYYIGQMTEAAQPEHKTFLVGVITNYMSGYIFPQIIRGIEERLSMDGHGMLLMGTHNQYANERKALMMILDRSVDAVIVEPTKGAYPNQNLDLYHVLQKKGIPIVMLHSAYDDLSGPVLTVDDTAGAAMAVKHMAMQGHQRVGAIIKMDEKQGIARLEGYLEALHQTDLAFRREWTMFFTSEGWSNVCSQYADRLSKMHPSQRPTGVFCFNDVVAVVLMRELRSRGINVPEGISIVGFDDAEMAELSHPPLTTMAHPKTEMGKKAAETALVMLEDKQNKRIQATTDFTFHARLIMRDSVRKLEPAYS